jgi:hypothetical protein
VHWLHPRHCKIKHRDIPECRSISEVIGEQPVRGFEQADTAGVENEVIGEQPVRGFVHDIPECRRISGFSIGRSSAPLAHEGFGTMVSHTYAQS